MEGTVAGGTTIRLDVPRLGDLTTRAPSEVHSIAGLAWHIEAVLFDWSADGSREKDMDLEVYVYCNSERTDFSCEADIKFTLRANRGRKQMDSVMREHSFPTRDDSQASHEWDDIFDTAKKPYFRERYDAVIEATVTVKKVSYALMTSLCDFSIPQPDITDVALVIGEKRLYVSKQLLAVHSPVFRAMFFSDFVEKDKKEIPIEDVDFDEFVEFLHFIYSSRKPITAGNLEFLLSLGDRFNSAVVLRECEAFLCGPAGSTIPLEMRLLYADRFRLSHLQSHCLNSIKSFDEAHAMHGTSEFVELSDKMKAALLEKVFILGYTHHGH